MRKTEDRKIKQTAEEIKEGIKALAKKANELTGLQLNLLSNHELGDEDIDGAFDKSTLDNYANPKESYRLYYGIMAMLINNLPKGVENKRLRQHIYEEKNLFLNQGIHLKANGRRGSDGRMTFINPILDEAYSIVSNWVVSGANPYDIYIEFRNINELNGYHNS